MTVPPNFASDQPWENIVKNLRISLAGALMLGAAWPALAGPDFQIIESARKAKQEALMAQRADSREVVDATGRTVKCPSDPLVLPLDHGPRAQTTPGENRQRQARYEAQVKACAVPAK